MIRGIGVDIVDLARFERALRRTPRLRDRLFAESERSLPAASLAARFAAREALIKALGHGRGLGWHDLELTSDEHGDPHFVTPPVLAAALADRGAQQAHVTMTHDAGVACAFVVLEGETA